jgi:hypothetical protein
MRWGGDRKEIGRRYGGDREVYGRKIHGREVI